VLAFVDVRRYARRDSLPRQVLAPIIKRDVVNDDAKSGATSEQLAVAESVISQMAEIGQV
jgi:hypothetical protein